MQMWIFKPRPWLEELLGPGLHLSAPSFPPLQSEGATVIDFQGLFKSGVLMKIQPGNFLVQCI